MGKYVLVLDCGATNVRAVAVGTDGKIRAAHAVPNNTQPDPVFSEGLIWDIDEIWGKFCACIRAVLHQVKTDELVAVTVTTFGVNGAPVNKEGELLYPVISWQCQRTVPLMDEVEAVIPFERLYQVSGVYQYSFNTLYSLFWIKKHHPEILDEMAGFLFITSLLVHRLCGELVNDTTMAGTSMLTDLQKREFSTTILESLGLPNKFLRLEEPGTRVGRITEKACRDTGIPGGIPVVLAGHDTQFALIGSGAGENEVVVSSGTWEILMTRSRHVATDKRALEAGLTNELDAAPGVYNTGKQWLSSGVLEWVKANFFCFEQHTQADRIYDIMQEEGTAAIENPGNLHFDTNLATDQGSISGVGIHTNRGQVYLAALRALTEKMKEALMLVEEIGKFRADALIIAGGGSRNGLWNKIRSNTLGIPVKRVKQSETTVMGAAIQAMVAEGIFPDVDTAAEALSRNYELVYPDA